MIINSDNDALAMLDDSFWDNESNKVQKDLGVEVSDGNSTDDFITVKGYASLFRILFNASYLSRDNSEKALKMLSGVEFKKGIVAGVPPEIVVSHKYGERQLCDISQLHDCGIVYYPNHPYLLCIMTRGSDYNKLASVIKDISKTIYTDLNIRYKGK